MDRENISEVIDKEKESNHVNHPSKYDGRLSRRKMIVGLFGITTYSFLKSTPLAAMTNEQNETQSITAITAITVPFYQINKIEKSFTWNVWWY